MGGLSAAVHGIVMASALYGTVLGALMGAWPADLRETRPSALRIFDVNLRQHFHDREMIERSLELASP